MKTFWLSCMMFILMLSAYAQTQTDPVPDSRRAARAIASSKDTAVFLGQINYRKVLLDGKSIWVYNDFKAKFYREGEDLVLKPFYFTENEKVLYDNESCPLKAFPRPIDCTVSELSANMSGFDQDWRMSLFGLYEAKTWLARQPFLFIVSPSQKPVIIPFDLAGMPPDAAGLLIEEWGKSLIVYNQYSNGFNFWIDPTITYHYTIIDRRTGAVIVPRTELFWGDLPPLPSEGGVMGMAYKGGFEVLGFRKDGWHQGTHKFSPECFAMGYPAAIFSLKKSELKDQPIGIGFGNFAGRVQAELTWEDGRHQEVLNFTWSNPEDWQSTSMIETFGADGVVISFIKDPHVWVSPEYVKTWDQSFISLSIYRPNPKQEEDIQPKE